MDGYKQIDSVIESCRITANLLIGILLSIVRKFEAFIYRIDSYKKYQRNYLPESCGVHFTDISARLVIAKISC